MMAPMKRRRKRRPSSLMLEVKVFPRALSPMEWRASLKTRITLRAFVIRAIFNSRNV